MAKTVRTSGAYTLEPGNEVVTLKNGLYFTPVAFASLPSSPAAGMVVFNTTGTKFQGYTGASWVDLN